jgi:hypothetical protein
MAANCMITAADVKLVRLDKPLLTHPAAEVITKGQLVGIDSNGKFALADADTGPVYPRGIAITGASQIGETISAVAAGLVDLGAGALGDLAFGAFVYASATAGGIYDGVVNSLDPVGFVDSGWGANTAVADKLLHMTL